MHGELPVSSFLLDCLKLKQSLRETDDRKRCIDGRSGQTGHGGILNADGFYQQFNRMEYVNAPVSQFSKVIV